MYKKNILLFSKTPYIIILWDTYLTFYSILENWNKCGANHELVNVAFNNLYFKLIVNKNTRAKINSYHLLGAIKWIKTPIMLLSKGADSSTRLLIFDVLETIIKNDKVDSCGENYYLVLKSMLYAIFMAWSYGQWCCHKTVIN